MPFLKSPSEKWDFDTYIYDQKLTINETIKSLTIINKLVVNESPYSEYMMFKYVISHIKCLNILMINNNKQTYLLFFNLLKIMFERFTESHLVNIKKDIDKVYNELQIISQISSLCDDDISYMFDVCKMYYNYNNQTIMHIVCAPHTKIEDEYCIFMKDLLFDDCELKESHAHYSQQLDQIDKKTTSRIMAEISSIKYSLPLNWESTIWFRMSDKINLFSFLISGPKNTPYENGLFEFHGYFPLNYPNTPPKITFMTTGNNSVRFNPNLYNNGKVCLSLLNTWNGEGGEKWNSSSTFLQVLISIQSLIFIEEPYFNEPGYETKIDTDIGKSESDNYNIKIYPETVNHAMIGMINNPPNGFADVVKNHFKYKKYEIIQTLNKWKINAEQIQTFDDLIK